MTLRIQGIQLGDIGSGPISLALEQLDDVSINSPISGQFLRYNGVSGTWQNTTLDADVFSYLSTNLLSSGNITITPIVGPNTITLGLVLNDADIVASLGYIPVDRAGDTMTGSLILNADPTDPFGAATKHYVDNVAAGLTIHPSCVTGTTSALTASYNNGSAGVGATLTGIGSLPLIGGYAPVLDDRVLVKDQTSAIQNGIYVVTATGPNWILTRSTDFDGSPTSDITAGDLVFVQDGSLGGTQWVQVTTGTVIVGSSPIVFEQFSGPGTYSGGPGIDVTGTIISNTGVLSATGTSGQIVVSASTGAVTFSLPSNITGLNTVTATSFIGNASSATILQTGRTISATGDATGTSATFNGSANASIPLTLATVNSSPQTDQFRKITVNGKGLVTATSAVTAGDITSLVDGTYVNVTGDTMTGALALTLNSDSSTGILSTNSSAGTSAQSRIAFNNDLADSLSIGVNSSAFSLPNFGLARESHIRSSTTSTGLFINAQAGNLRLATNSTERLRIDTTGAWGLAGANYGSSGQVLASNGAGSAPTWQSVSGIIAGDYVAKTGDTMTGTLTMSQGGIPIIMTAGPGVAKRIGIQTSGNYRWSFGSDGSPESGSNSGSDFIVQRFDDAGTSLGVPFTIARATGLVTVSGNLSTGGSVNATGGFIGNLTGSSSLNVLKAGDTMTGNLLMQGANVTLQSTSDGNNGVLRILNTGGSTLMQAYTDVNAGYLGTIDSKPLRLLTGGSTKATITSTGDIGVGTTTPTSAVAVGRLVEVSGTTAGFRANGTTGSIGLETYVGEFAGFLNVTSNHPLVFATNNSERIRISSTGLVGIGAPSTGARLYVSGTSNFTDQTIIQAAGNYTGYSSGLTLGYTGNNTEYGMTLVPDSTTVTTTALAFLSSASTLGSPTLVGSIQQLAANTGMNLNGNWSINGASFITSSNIASQTVSSANTLTTARSITATGDASWTVNFNGGSNVSAALTLATVNANVGTFNNVTVNAKGLVTAASNVGYLTGNQTISISGDATGSGTTSIGLTFATVNASPQTDAFRKITVNSKGLVTATSAVTSGDITTALGYTPYNSTNPAGYTSNTGTVTSVSGTGTVNGLTLSGTVTTSGNLTLGGTLSGISNAALANSSITIGTTAISLGGSSASLAGMTTISASGTITAGAFNATSTADVKDRIEDLSQSYLDRFEQLRPREYDRTDYVAHEFGFIAEEMQTVYPEIVGKDETGKPTGIDYGKLSTILTAKVLEQDTLIKDLQRQIDNLLILIKGKQ